MVDSGQPGSSNNSNNFPTFGTNPRGSVVSDLHLQQGHSHPITPVLQSRFQEQNPPAGDHLTSKQLPVNPGKVVSKDIDTKEDSPTGKYYYDSSKPYPQESTEWKSNYEYKPSVKQEDYHYNEQGYYEYKDDSNPAHNQDQTHFYFE